MEYIWYSFVGILSGVLGGMGMGGGTILIPLLSIFYGVNQHIAQATNLISFIPMASVALIIHLKNKMVEFKGILYIIFTGLLTCVIGVYIANQMPEQILRKCFGGFLVLLSIYQFISTLKDKKE